MVRPNTSNVTSLSLRSFVIVFGAIAACFLRSALLIFLSTNNFHNLLYDTAIICPPSCIKNLQNSIKYYTTTVLYLQETFAQPCEVSNMQFCSHFSLFYSCITAFPHTPSSFPTYISNILSHIPYPTTPTTTRNFQHTFSIYVGISNIKLIFPTHFSNILFTNEEEVLSYHRYTG